MFKRTDTGLVHDDAVAMLDYAAESFAKLAAQFAAISDLTNRPALVRQLALTAQEMADGLAEDFNDFRDEYAADDAACQENGGAVSAVPGDKAAA